MRQGCTIIDNMLKDTIADNDVEPAIGYRQSGPIGNEKGRLASQAKALGCLASACHKLTSQVKVNQASSLEG
jgi:hypothetical protein